MTKHIHVDSMEKAWKKAAELFPTDWDYDNGSRERAGYPIYRSTADGHYYDYICDLCARLEINLSDNTTINIWIDEPETVEELEEKPDAEIQAAIDASADAKAAGAAGFLNFTEENLVAFSFVVGHDTWDSGAERRTAENLLSVAHPSLLIYDYAGEWFKARGLEYMMMEVKDKPHKVQHGADADRYHVTFSVLAKLPAGVHGWGLDDSRRF